MVNHRRGAADFLKGSQFSSGAISLVTPPYTTSSGCQETSPSSGTWTRHRHRSDRGPHQTGGNCDTDTRRQGTVEFQVGVPCNITCPSKTARATGCESSDIGAEVGWGWGWGAFWGHRETEEITQGACFALVCPGYLPQSANDTNSFLPPLHTPSIHLRMTTWSTPLLWSDHVWPLKPSVVTVQPAVFPHVFPLMCYANWPREKDVFVCLQSFNWVYSSASECVISSDGSCGRSIQRRSNHFRLIRCWAFLCGTANESRHLLKLKAQLHPPS